MIRRILASTLVITVLWTTTWAAAPVQAQGSVPESLSREEALKRLGELMALVGELLSTIDRSQFDLEALVESLGFEAEAIITFVRDGIYYEQYRGLLRGAEGTLMTRAGNALDQSLLLATLLKDAGYDARIVGGELGRADAERLLESMFEKPAERAPAVDEVRFRAKLRELEGQVGLEAGTLDTLWTGDGSASKAREEISAKAASDASFIQEHLKKAGIELSDRSVEVELMEEAAVYYWVEYREELSDTWQSVHPSFAASMPEPKRLEALEFFSDSVPDHLQHRFRFRAVIEQRLGSELLEHEIVPGWERPTANLVGVPLSYMSVPDTFNRLGDYDGIGKALSAAEFFAPVFNKSDPGKPFDLNGDVIPLDALAFAGAGFLKRVGAKLESAANALSGLGTGEDDVEQDLRALQAVWLEYTFLAPGGEEETFRRRIFDGTATADPVGKGSNGAVELLNTLASRHHFMVGVGRLPSGLLLDRVLEQILLMRPGFEAAMKSGPQALLRTQFEDLGLELLALLSSFEEFSVDAGVRYRAEPALVVVEQRLGEKKTQVLTDIVTSPWRSLQWDAGNIDMAVKANLEGGAWESRVEAEFHPLSESKAFDVPEFLEEQPVDGKVLVIDAEEDLADIEIPPLLQEELRHEMRLGQIVVLPVATLQSVPAYWSVNREDFSAVARAVGNRGVAFREYVEVAIGWGGLGALFFVIPTGPCVLGVIIATGLNPCAGMAACAALGFEVGVLLSGTGTGTLVGLLFIATAFVIGLGVSATCDPAEWE